MAQKNAFDVLLDSIGDDTDRKALGEIAEKYPDLRNGVLRQSDYSRRMDELKKQQEDLQSQLDYANRWKDWEQQNWDPEKNLTKREVEFQKMVDSSTAKVKELEAKLATGGEVTFEEMQARLRESGDFLTKADLQAKETEIQKTLAEMKNNLNVANHIASTLPHLAVKHYQEFGEVLNNDELLKFAVDNKANDLGAAHDLWVQGRRDEVKAKALEDRIQKAREEAVSEFREKQGMGAESMPVDGGEPDMGAFQRMTQEVLAANTGGNPHAPFGDGSIARVAAREMARAS